MPGKEFYNDMKKSEIVVAKYLNDMGFDWFYEQPLFVYDEKKRPRVWAPDFYLPGFQIYLEVCGSKDFENSYKYREKIYKKNGVPVVFLHLYRDKKEWQKWLQNQIYDIEENRHNKTMSLVKKLLLK